MFRNHRNTSSSTISGTNKVQDSFQSSVLLPKYICLMPQKTTAIAAYEHLVNKVKVVRGCSQISLEQAPVEVSCVALQTVGKIHWIFTDESLESFLVTTSGHKLLGLVSLQLFGVFLWVFFFLNELVPCVYIVQYRIRYSLLIKIRFFFHDFSIVVFLLCVFSFLTHPIFFL